MTPPIIGSQGDDTETSGLPAAPGPRGSLCLAVVLLALGLRSPHCQPLSTGHCVPKSLSPAASVCHNAPFSPSQSRLPPMETRVGGRGAVGGGSLKDAEGGSVPRPPDTSPP